VSNVCRGGVAVLVDEAGRLQNEAIDQSGTRYEGHPDTGIRFEGRAVPFYDGAVALCRRAHLALAPDLFLIGWDAAITPRGPIILEANLFPGLRPDLIRPEDVAAYKTWLLARLERLYAERPPLFRTWAAARAGGAALLAGLIALLLWVARLPELCALNSAAWVRANTAAANRSWTTAPFMIGICPGPADWPCQLLPYRPTSLAHP
jgi:hypothetical protein